MEELTVRSRRGPKRFASKLQLLETAKGRDGSSGFSYSGPGGGVRGPVTLREQRDIGTLKGAREAPRAGGDARDLGQS